MAARTAPGKRQRPAVARARATAVTVAAALREGLADGRFRSGERLKEIPLAEQLGVSRGPVRDALRLLHEDGLLELLPNRGAVVPAVHAADVLEVYALRCALGALALHKIVGQAARTDGAALGRRLGALDEAVAAGDEPAAVRADLAFQDEIVRAAGLRRVTVQFERLTLQVRMFVSLLDAHYDDKLGVMLREDAALLDAIAAGDVAGAEARWREKFERWVRDFVEHVPEEDFDRALWVALTRGPSEEC